MVLLMLFALIAGAGTALSPCVLPVLPAVLSAGVTGGRKRPAGIVVGLVASFTFAAVALVYVIDALGLPDDFTRWLAIVVIGFFGIVLIMPPLADRLEGAISRITPGPASVKGDGFGSGLALGASLGLVYFPCAGPILSGVIVASASQDFTAGKLAVALAYAVGSGAVLYAMMIGGRRITVKLAPNRGRIQIGMGVVMVALAVAMSANLDTRFQNAIASDLPSFLVNPTGGLESSDAIQNELASVRGQGPGPGVAADQDGGAAAAKAGATLPKYGAAPEITDPGEWFNTDGKSLSIKQLTDSGHVVLIDFWTYTCINCIRTLPYVKAWDEKYRKDGLVVIGVHTPEFPFEREASNVSDAIDQNQIKYPVVQDNDYGTWDAFANQYWPAKYLIGSDGQVRYVHFGEGDYGTTEDAIRSLLAESGAKDLGGDAQASSEVPDPSLKSPETYLGSARAMGWVKPPVDGEQTYEAPDPSKLKLNDFAYGGSWNIGKEAATAAKDSSVSLRFQARRVFLVLGSEGGPKPLRVELDGKPISAADAGDDVINGTAEISNQRLYRLVDLPKGGQHTLTLRFAPGISGYAFTFG
jgi:cytochrome c biogenesis protein CcdA/thiol-disulfide isomerase/thioredoxin